jgi:hypothetical protein
MRKIFSENYPQFGHGSSKNFRQPCSRPKEFEDYQFLRGVHTSRAGPEVNPKCILKYTTSTSESPTIILRSYWTLWFSYNTAV